MIQLFYCYLITFASLVFTSSMKVLAGLNVGRLCAGIMIEVPFVMFLPVFSALVLIVKEPNPLKYTFSPYTNDLITSSINDSTTL